jgi:hypothetical protein
MFRLYKENVLSIYENNICIIIFVKNTRVHRMGVLIEYPKIYLKTFYEDYVNIQKIIIEYLIYTIGISQNMLYNIICILREYCMYILKYRK